MGHFRFKCKMPPRPPPSPPRPDGYPIVNGQLPSFMDCELAFVDDDGREHEIRGWRRFTFDSGEPPGDVVRGGLEVDLVGVEVEVEVPEDTMDRYVSAGPRAVPRRSALGRPMGWTRPHTPEDRVAVLEDTGNDSVDAIMYAMRAHQASTEPRCTCGSSRESAVDLACPVHGSRPCR